jgi:3-isopropylmalate dehydrogenase
MTKNILVLAGDGIGPEVCNEAVKILEWFNENQGTDFAFSEANLGGIAYDLEGDPFPQTTVEAARKADAILLGAVGGPKWEPLDISVRPERGLLGIRKELGLFANLRPAMVFDELAEASSLKKEIVSGLDIMIVRELTGGIYFGEPKGIEIKEDGSRMGFNTLVYYDYEVQRIARVAFDLAQKRGGKLCSVDKANVLVATEMWREEVAKIGAEEYPEIELSNMYVDNAAMQLVRDPKQFDVVVTTNMFGDILSDCAAMLTGSLGMLPSASLGDADSDVCNALYEPVHGSAPDIAGQNKANPIATVLSAAMMLRYSFNLGAEADMLEKAIANVLASGLRTGDIMQAGGTPVGTTEMGAAIVVELDKLAKI